MTYRSEHRQATDDGCRADAVSLWLTTQKHSAELRQFDNRATLVISTGAMRMQSYATAHELRKLANAFLAAAQSVDAIECETQQVAA